MTTEKTIISGLLIAIISSGIVLGLLVVLSDYRINSSLIDVYGNNLAKWADKHHVNIKINGLVINGVGPNSGGYSPVYWSYPFINQSITEMFRTNLKKVIDQRSCSFWNLHFYLSKDISNDTKEQLLENIGCFGTFEFSNVSWGLD